MWAIMGKIEGIGITCVDIQLRLFKALVAPVGDYGCQIWGVDHLGLSDTKIFGNPMQQVVFTFLRLISGCRRSTEKIILLREFGMLPTQVKYARLCARMWNKSLSNGFTGAMRATMLDDIWLFRRMNTECWTAKFLKGMMEIGLTPPGATSLVALRALPIETLAELRFNEAAVEKAFTEVYERRWPIPAGDPRRAASSGVMRVKHATWFQLPAPFHLKMIAPAYHVKNLLRFRLGSAPLRVNDHSVRIRAHRVCKLCRRNWPVERREIEDEMHVVLECAAYSDIRRDPRYTRLFTGTSDMKSFMGYSDQHLVSRFIDAVMKKREILLLEEDGVRVAFGGRVGARGRVSQTHAPPPQVVVRRALTQPRARTGRRQLDMFDSTDSSDPRLTSPNGSVEDVDLF